MNYKPFAIANTNNKTMGIIGDKMCWGFELVEVCSIVVRGMVNVKMIDPFYKDKVVHVNVNELSEL